MKVTDTHGFALPILLMVMLVIAILFSFAGLSDQSFLQPLITTSPLPSPTLLTLPSPTPTHTPVQPSPTVSSPTSTPSPPIISPTSPQTSCLTAGRPVVTLSGLQEKRYDIRKSPVAENTVIDAREALWIAQWPLQDNFDYPVLLAGGPNVCLIGGTVQGKFPENVNNDPHTTWDLTHSTAAVEFFMPGFVMQGTRVHNFGDGIRTQPDSDNFRIEGVYFSHMRDDCIENDDLHNGIVTDSLLDGCYTGFSARTSCTSCDGSNNVMTIQNNLVRMEPMFGVYKNRGTIPGHGSFFKWSTDTPSNSPKLKLYNNIFRADQQSSGGSLGLPKGKILDCQNNILVWLGPPGSIPQYDSSDQDPITNCFTITTDQSVWDNAVTKWKEQRGF